MSEPSTPTIAHAEERSSDRPVRFHRLAFHAEHDGVTVGRPDLGDFVQLPPDGAALLRRLVDGEPPAAAGRWYLDTYGEPIDVADFVAELAALDFVLDDDEVEPAADPLRWARVGRWVYSRWGLVIYLGLLCGWGVAMARHPVLLPTPDDVLFAPYLSVVAVTLFVAQIPFLLAHEAAHMLAGQRIGLPSRLSIGRRLHMIVLETSMNGLVAVPRGRRFLPILAGVLCDVAAMAALTVVAAATLRPDGSLSLVGGFALAMSYVTLLRIVWQTNFFLRTDFYYLATTVLGCVDLHGVSRQLIGNTARRLLGRPPRHDPRAWHPRDRSVARWYSVLMIVGVAGLLAVLVWGTAPVFWHVVTTVGSRLTGSGDLGWAGVVDSVVLLALSLGEIAVVVWLTVRERRRAAAVGRVAEPAL